MQRPAVATDLEESRFVIVVVPIRRNGLRERSELRRGRAEAGPVVRTYETRSRTAVTHDEIDEILNRILEGRTQYQILPAFRLPVELWIVKSRTTTWVETSRV